MKKIRENNEEEEQGNEDIIETWNKKRLFVASVVILSVLFLSGYYAVGALKNKFRQNTDVLGSKTSTSKEKIDVKIPSSDDVEKIIEEAKNSLSKMTSENITASQAAIGKIIYDFKQLQNGNKDTKEYICEVVCKK